MKRIILILSFTIVSLFALNLKAQYNYVQPPSSSEYDLLYVFDTNYIVNCFLTDNPTNTSFTHPVSGSVASFFKFGYVYSKFEFYNQINKEWCNPDAPLPDGYVIGANVIDDSLRYAEAFAQEYSFQAGDIPYNDYVVVGVAMKIGDYLDSMRHVCVLNQNFDTIGMTVYHTNPVQGHNWNKGGWNTYYFPHDNYDSLRNINDFRLAFDVPRYGYNNNVFRVIHTCNVYSPCIRDSINALGGPYQAGLHYDTIFMGLINRFQNGYNDFILNPYKPGAVYQAYIEYMEQFDEDDHIPLCSFPDPKYLKHNGEWVEFSEDPVYEIWRNIYIAMVPIIMVPQQSSQLTEVELQKMCYLVPNPTRDYFKALSHYTIESVQVFDLTGKLLMEEKLNHFEALIDVSDFAAGTYVVKINTVKGSVEKKMIVQ
ncbi:MAG: T9SS type A sorting domain-containing protein [Bacteroidales bacterium]|nr:T9SS type A sorting domain-containing protein [Bacteroidales bacterium]